MADMKWEVSCEETANRCRIILVGHYDPQQTDAVYQDIVNQPAWRSGRNLIWDFRHCQFPDLTVEDLQSVSQFRIARDAELGDGRSAIVLDDIKGKAMATVVQNTTNHRISGRLRVFKSMAKAEAWLTD